MTGAEAGAAASAGTTGSEAAASGTAGALAVGDAATATGSEAAGWAGIPAGVATATAPGAEAGAAGAPTGADAALILFSSSMFLDSSAMRADASLACLSLASWSSAAFWPVMAPLDRVSLSGAAVAGFLSSTRACTVPLAERSAAATSAVGAAAASLRRKALKSRLCAARTWRASPTGVANAVASSGICSTAPALTRLTLPWMKASGLARISATSIWSSDTLAGR